MPAEPDFLRRLLAARERWVPLAEGDGAPAVKVRRPPEAHLPQLLQRGGIDEYIACVVDWRGVTEATLLGARVASDTPLTFSAEVWREAALDRVEWVNAVAQAVQEDAASYLEQRERDRGN